MRRSILRGLVIFNIYHWGEDRARYQPFSSRYPVCFILFQNGIWNWHLSLEKYFILSCIVPSGWFLRQFEAFPLVEIPCRYCLCWVISGNSWQSFASILLVLQLTSWTSKFILITYILCNEECGSDVTKIGLSIHDTSFPKSWIMVLRRYYLYTIIGWLPCLLSVK